MVAAGYGILWLGVEDHSTLREQTHSLEAPVFGHPFDTHIGLLTLSSVFVNYITV
jgi:hypothetical protein